MRRRPLALPAVALAIRRPLHEPAPTRSRTRVLPSAWNARPPTSPWAYSWSPLACRASWALHRVRRPALLPCASCRSRESSCRSLLRTGRQGTAGRAPYVSCCARKHRMCAASAASDGWPGGLAWRARRAARGACSQSDVAAGYMRGEEAVPFHLDERILALISQDSLHFGGCCGAVFPPHSHRKLIKRLGHLSSKTRGSLSTGPRRRDRPMRGSARRQPHGRFRSRLLAPLPPLLSPSVWALGLPCPPSAPSSPSPWRPAGTGFGPCESGCIFKKNGQARVGARTAAGRHQRLREGQIGRFGPSFRASLSTFQ